ncbi:MAG: hypothetical protein MZV65_22335 [Chromatiales bacterium]|nr:hypothetical protein [Chromatiales bacterium]
MFASQIRKSIIDSGSEQIDSAVTEGKRMGSVFAWADFYYRQRLYIANNFLQHMEFAEAILPFYSWSLLNFKIRHWGSDFDEQTYRILFEKKFPALASIPRSDTLQRSRRIRRKASIINRRWAKSELGNIASRRSLTLLNKPWCFPRLVSVLVGRSPHDYIVPRIMALGLLEAKMRQRGIDFEWDGINFS